MFPADQPERKVEVSRLLDPVIMRYALPEWRDTPEAERRPEPRGSVAARTGRSPRAGRRSAQRGADRLLPRSQAQEQVGAVAAPQYHVLVLRFGDHVAGIAQHVALDCACGLYLNDPTAWQTDRSPTN